MEGILMEIYALVGPSGTGKSHRALIVAKEKNIDIIIDDGLLIQGNHIVSGMSAKKEKSRIAAIRTALFTQEEHYLKAKEKIEELLPERVLVLGTSMGMINKIIQRLGLEKPKEIINITDIASDIEIRSAKRIRDVEGKHVIPVPTFEIKKDFSGYFLDPLKIFSKRGKEFSQSLGEKSVVRPKFSYLGKYFISDITVSDIASHAAEQCKGIHKVIRTHVDSSEAGIVLHLEVVVTLPERLTLFIRDVQETIGDKVEQMTSLNVLTVNLTIQRLHIDKE